jgi:putative effector of murein hydrolase LrgA (UPF0299 family)
VNQFSIFFIRAVLGVVLAVLLTRIFFGRVSIGFVVALAVFMVAMAYFTAYLRRRKQK